MSILIKGMEMPKNCFECPWRCKVDPENLLCRISGEYFEETFSSTIQNRHKSCPLVEIPPHGRLKKRLVYRGEVYNALEAERVKSLDGILTDPYKEGFHDGLKRALQILANEVDDAPTIIEAEEGE